MKSFGKLLIRRKHPIIRLKPPHGGFLVSTFLRRQPITHDNRGCSTTEESDETQEILANTGAARRVRHRARRWGVRVLNVYVIDSLTSEVTFEARSSGPFFWRLEWLSGNGLFDYGDGNVVATVPVEFGTSFRFWMDFMAWTDLDTARVTFMNMPEE